MHGEGAVTDAAETVEERLRRLDTGTLTALVADLWAARGFDVDREDGVVVADDGVEREVVAAVGRRRLGSPSLPDRTVDVVVAPGGGSRARAFAEREGATLLDAVDLRGMLWHAVDRPRADDVVAAHLGAPIAELRPPPSIRAREFAGSATAGIAGEPLVTLSVVVLVVVAVGTVTVFGTPGRPAADLLGPDRPTPAADPVDPAAPGGAGATDDDSTADGTGDDEAIVVDAPGLSSSGVTNATALAAAHERQVPAGSYSLWLDVFAPRNRSPVEPVVQRDIDVSTADGRVLVRTEVGTDGDDRDHAGTAYFDDGVWYAADHTGPNVTYHSAEATSSLPVTAVDPDEFAAIAVPRYVATPDGRVTGTVEREGDRYYRYRGTGVPDAGIRTSVRDYRIVAVISPSGFVREAEVTYTTDTPSGSYEVTLQWTYGNVGTTTVVEPAWRSEAANASALVPDSAVAPGLAPGR